MTRAAALEVGAHLNAMQLKNLLVDDPVRDQREGTTPSADSIALSMEDWAASVERGRGHICGRSYGRRRLSPSLSLTFRIKNKAYNDNNQTYLSERTQHEDTAQADAELALHDSGMGCSPRRHLQLPHPQLIVQQHGGPITRAAVFFAEKTGC
jgi:hypothetical protein